MTRPDASSSAGRRIHHPRLHASARTDDYLFAQLIPYIGNKRKLLHLIEAAVELTGCSRGTFVDLFSGSTVVARWAKRKGFRTFANDWEPYAHEIALATIELNAAPEFAALGGRQRVFAQLNALPAIDGYVAQHLCPFDDERPDPQTERMFFTRANGGRIDAIREQIAEWERRGELAARERAYLLAALIYSVSYASNTSGVFKGFHHGWGGKTRTALYRILAPLALRPPVTFDNQLPNGALRENAQDLAARLRKVCGERPEIVYLDPPYNQHPYGSNYHVLNTVALWDKPPLGPSIAAARGDKAAIRTDWRTLRRSAYNSRREALPAFERLIESLDASWLLVSYSTDGNMPLEGVLNALARRGRLQVLSAPYKRYRVSTPRMSPKSHNVEFVAIVDTQAPANVDAVTAIVAKLQAAETDALRFKSCGEQPPSIC